MLKIQTLASGSDGNATYIASGATNILVDVGLSLPRLLARMQAAQINPETINAVLITHDHGDHISGLSSFLKKFKCIVYIHEQARKIFSALPDTQIQTFKASFNIGDITVDYFPVPHDSSFCFGYSFQNGTAKISMATDLGRIGCDILNKMTGSQIVLLECNHCLDKLHRNVKYPPILKRRIMGSEGHLSNAASSLAIYELAKQQVQQIILAHLSKENNTPQLAYSFVRDFLASKGVIEGVDISIDVATQDQPSIVFQVD